MERVDYGGSCEVTVINSGTVHGPWWVDVDFRNGRKVVVRLAVPEMTGKELAQAGPILLRLDDGRQFRAAVSIVLSSEALLTIL
jgi:hypothetical protein